MSTIIHEHGVISVPAAVKPLKMRPKAAIYRLFKRKVRGWMLSPYWQVRVRLAPGKYKQRSTNTTHRAAAKEFARHWIAQDFPQLCPALDIKPLVKPTLTVTTGNSAKVEPIAQPDPQHPNELPL